MVNLQVRYDWDRLDIVWDTRWRSVNKAAQIIKLAILEKIILGSPFFIFCVFGSLTHR